MQWLIDGHNLIGRMPNLSLSDPHDETKLLQILSRYRARTGHKITVVFDSGQQYQSGGTKKQGGITVQFAPSGKTADQIIVRRLRRIRNPQAVMVVTSDRAVQRAAQQAGVRVIDSADFGQQLLQSSSGSDQQDEGEQADIRLSSDEVDAWLDIFGDS